MVKLTIVAMVSLKTVAMVTLGDSPVVELHLASVRGVSVGVAINVSYIPLHSWVGSLYIQVVACKIIGQDLLRYC